MSFLFQPGDQIVYVPGHADGIDHPDAERGFVTLGGDPIFCRFWCRGKEGEQLRTKANSEGCHPRHLVKHDSVPQALIARFLEALEP